MAETTTIAVDYGDILSIEGGKRPGLRLMQQLEAARGALEARIAKNYPSDYGTEELAPVEVSLATLDVITESQRFRLCELIRSYQADTATLFRDTFGEGKNLGFALYKGREKTLASCIVNGMIEPDGRCHT